MILSDYFLIVNTIFYSLNVGLKLRNRMWPPMVLNETLETKFPNKFLFTFNFGIGHSKSFNNFIYPYLGTKVWKEQINESFLLSLLLMLMWWWPQTSDKWVSTYLPTEQVARKRVENTFWRLLLLPNTKGGTFEWKEYKVSWPIILLKNILKTRLFISFRCVFNFGKRRLDNVSIFIYFVGTRDLNVATIGGVRSFRKFVKLNWFLAGVRLG